MNCVTLRLGWVLSPNVSRGKDELREDLTTYNCYLFIS